MSISLRVLSVDARSFGRDRVALARLISAAAPDVACVHGGPHLLRWRSVCAALGRRAGLVVVSGGRPAGANLLLSTLGVDVAAVRDVRFTTVSGRNQPGGALAALRLRGADFVLASASLIGNSAVRLAQARELQSAMDGLVPDAPPAIVSAEGPDRPGTAAWQSLANGREAVAARLFVDRRISVGEITDLARGGPGDPPVVVELEL